MLFHEAIYGIFCLEIPVFLAEIQTQPIALILLCGNGIHVYPSTKGRISGQEVTKYFAEL